MDGFPTSPSDHQIALIIFGTTLLSGLGMWIIAEARGNRPALGLIAALWLVLATMAGIAGAPFPVIMMAGTALAAGGLAALRWAEAHW